MRGTTVDQTEKKYDLFVSYDDDDEEWVDGYLLDALKAAGVCIITRSAFRLGVPKLAEFERAVMESHRVLLVCSPAYLTEPTDQFVDVLTQHYGIDTGTWPVIPLILHRVALPQHLSMLTSLDATDPTDREKVIRRLCDALEVPVPKRSPVPDCPYPGMKPFREEQGDLFFGREDEVRDAVERLRLHSFLAVVGPSGVGKSSMVLAGLVPTLRERRRFGPGDWQVCIVRPGQSPATNLAEKLGLGPDLLDINEPEQLAPADLLPYLGENRLLLVIDQFEEIFTLADEAEAASFQQAILTLTSHERCYVVLTVRADFYENIMLCHLWPQIEGNQLSLRPLTRDRLQLAIEKPAEDRGVYIERDLVERLLNEAADAPGSLPFIQEALAQMWEGVFVN